MPDWIWLAGLFLFGDKDDDAPGPPPLVKPGEPDETDPIVGPPPVVRPPTPLNPGQIVQPWIKSTPDDGFFYQVQGKDNLFRIVQEAIGTNPNHPLNVPYAQIVTASTYNQRVYGTPIDPDGNATEKATGANGLWLKRAFLPRHANNQARILDGIAPRRNIRMTIRGQPCGSGSAYAFLWLPAVRNDSGVLVVEQQEPPEEISWLQPVYDGTMETCA